MTPKAVKPRKYIGLKITALLLIVCAALLLLSKYGLSVTRYDLGFADLPEAFEGFRVVQLSDLHGSRFGRDNARLVAAVKKEAPDIIALTGDFIDEGKVDEELSEVGPLVAALRGIAPVYFISGNHDWASGGIEELAGTLADAGAVYLRNDYVTLERSGSGIVLCGVEDPNGRADMVKPDELVDSIHSEYGGSFILMLAHRNYWVEKYPDLGVDVILCGHSHGGIVRIPGLGGLFGTNADFMPEYETGVFSSGRYDMIVSRGLGNSVSVPRFLNTPEIVSLTLHNS